MQIHRAQFTAPWIWASPSSIRRTSTDPTRTRFLVGKAIKKKGSARVILPRNSATCGLRTANSSAERQARVRQGRVRCLAGTPQRRPHRPVLSAPRRSAVPIEETVGAMADLVRGAGKVRFLGLSEASAQTCGARTPYILSPPCRRSTRCGAATWRTRSCPPSQSAPASGSSRTVRSGRGFLTGQIKRPEDIAEAIGGRTIALSGGELPEESRSRPARRSARAPETVHTRPALRSRGCSPRERHRPIPGTKHRSMWKKTSLPHVTLSGAELAQIEGVGTPAGARYR